MFGERDSQETVEARARERAFAESLPHLVWTMLPDGTVEFFNTRWVEYTGVGVTDKAKAWALVHPDDVPSCAERWRESLATGNPYQIEYRLRRADGVFRWHLALAHAVRDASGVVLKWLGTSTDIDDQKRAGQREALLAKTSAVLGASLDYETTLASIVSAAVPDFADSCAMELLEPTGSLTTRQVAVAHVDPSKAPLMRLFRSKYPVDPAEPYGTGQVIRSGTPELYADIPDELIDATARDAEYASLLRQIGVKSTITVPLTIRGVALGALSFALGSSDRRYDARDVAVALEVARRAAISIDNARLYKKVKDEEERLRMAMDAAQMGSWDWDIASGNVIWSPSLERLHGIPVGSFAGTLEASRQHVHPDDRERVHASIGETVQAGVGHHLSYRIVRADGAVRWIDAWGRFLMNEQGEAARLLGVCMDVTEKRQADEERARLLASEQRAREEEAGARHLLETTLRSIGDAVIATDASGRVTFVNTVAEALTGWPEGEARGRPLSEVFVIVNDRTRKTVESPVDRVLREGAVVGLANHTVLVGRRGIETHIDDSGAPIRDDEGRLLGVILVFRDVTLSKREEAKRDYLAEASAALASSLDYRATLASVARLAVPKLADWCSVDVVNTSDTGFEQVAVAHVDPAKVAMADEFGKRYPPDPNATTGVPNVLRTGRSELYTVIPEELLIAGAQDAEHLRIIRELKLHSAMIVPLIARGRTLGAMTFVFAESGRSYGPADQAFAEDLARRAAIAVDNARLFTSEQVARRAADEASRAKDEFLATVSHELRTPLNAMLGWARMLRAGNLPESGRLRAVETIERNAVAQTQLIEDLLDVSRIISGKLRLDVKTLSMASIIEEAIDSLRLAIDAKEIQLQPMLDGAAGEIMGDPVRLQQVVWNLLSNAIKFTPKKGKIRIVLERIDSQIAISVIDDGQGIPADFLPYVFDRFKQAEGGITRTHGGLGLGLAITRHLVELHGGKVEVHSKGEGHGARFTVLLPLSPVRLSGSRLTPTTHKPPTTLTLESPAVLKGLRVLVVDDEADARDLLEEILVQCGVIVRTAGSSNEALEMIAADPPDVLLSDIGMPNGDGYELIERVRQLPAGAGGDLPAAALTAYARAEDRRRALNAGYMMHVPKPVEPAELVAVVANLARFRR